MAVWGIVPAAGAGSRIQPLAFSKELLPVGTRGGDADRPRAVSELLVERLILGGANRICFVIAPGKSDILEYYGGVVQQVPVCYVVQGRPAGLCDAVFHAAPVVARDDHVLIGLPDTVWLPAPALTSLPADRLALLLFPVEEPQRFDAVITRRNQSVIEVQVKSDRPGSEWIWGAIGMPGRVFQELLALWIARGRSDEYLGTLFNAYIAAGNDAVGVRAGTAYMDVGTLRGYRDAIQFLQRHDERPPVPTPKILGELASQR